MSTISIIVPCYKEEEALPFFWKETSKVTKKMEADFEDLKFEFIFVDDGSSDNTLEEICDFEINLYDCRILITLFFIFKNEFFSLLNLVVI